MDETKADTTVPTADAFALWLGTLPPDCIVVATQPGCRPCKQGAVEIVAPLVSMGWHVVFIDISHSITIAEKLQVTSTPTYIGFSGGVEVGRCQNPDKSPLKAAWVTIEGWFKPKTTTQTEQSATLDPHAIIAEWFRGRNWLYRGNLRQHLVSHGMPDDMLAYMDAQTMQKLHAALHEMESAAFVLPFEPAVDTLKAPSPPRE